MSSLEGIADAETMDLKSFYGPLHIQESTLLNIPSEIRLSIYDAVCEMATEVTVCYRDKHSMKGIKHPLIRVCRQTYKEFGRIWARSGVNHATTVVCAISNFEIGDLGKIKEWLIGLPTLTGDIQRRCVLRFFIDNNFGGSVQQKHLQRHRMSEAAGKIKFEVDIAFDHATLGTGHILSLMQRNSVLSAVRDAFQHAVRRHKSKQAELRRIRVEARSTAFEASAEGELE